MRRYADGELRSWTISEDVAVTTTVIAASEAEAWMYHSLFLKNLGQEAEVAAGEMVVGDVGPQGATITLYDDGGEVSISSGDECPVYSGCPITGLHTMDDHEAGARCPQYADCRAPMPHAHVLISPGEES